ncbi:hypothetical protein Q4F19_05895 [Sphingomonas sp. BIUV-7]|uniref:Uncharacterized protein n=1 Tax=Sphingomonas natans TaxID=3063330 RepID=A0ABT8Y7C0_9SPHN|nr:hypothetical protein [Sphingomonas sp. BIUV-7]MDO6413907.1 hypothetical protein [Sphingomonas sp. BIUV-7]
MSTLSTSAPKPISISRADGPAGPHRRPAIRAASARRLAILLAALFAAPIAQAAPLVLESAGLSLPSGQHIRFGMKATAATALATAALGPPVKRGIYPDCGQGIPIAHVHYKGELELSFIAGKFVGWTLDRPGPKTAKGIGIGATFADVRRAYPDADVDLFDDWVRFTTENGPGGFLDGKGPKAKIVSLNAGQTCIVD